MNRTERAERVKRDLEKLKPIFPECNQMVYSICSRPSQTGATWTKLARETMGRRDTHKLHHSLRVRVTEERYNQVKAIIEAEGRFPTVNAWLDWWVWVYIKNKESRSPAGTEERQGDGNGEASASEYNTKMEIAKNYYQEIRELALTIRTLYEMGYVIEISGIMKPTVLMHTEGFSALFPEVEPVEYTNEVGDWLRWQTERDGISWVTYERKV